ncbi:serine dehydratase subunit alpha family protein [Thermovenabulum sp.]|uniref:L-cysteine desulfidase family protein n=1 Tax=Thermovenabulum sp. TaxID=3100335 RepID=UPI003C7A52C5
MDCKELLKILRSELKLATGCTEPAGVAFATAKAVELLGEEVLKVKVTVSTNVFKNGMGVYVPGADNKGLEYAAALGAVIVKPELELGILEDVDGECIKRALKLIKEGAIEITYLSGCPGVYIKVEAESANHESTVIIKGNHTNIIYLEVDGKILKDEVKEDKRQEEEKIKDWSIKDIIDTVNKFSEKDLLFLKEVIKINADIAQKGLNEKWGMGIGFTLNEMFIRGILNKDMVNTAKAWTAGAIDARMAGVKMPVISCGGSGNQGIMASIPVIVASEYLEVDEISLLKALALSFLITLYIKSHIGRLSALCGCAVASCMGSGAGIAYLMNLGEKGIMEVIQNIVGCISGIICDGAKPGCSLKALIAVETAFQMVFLTKYHIMVEPFSGIVSRDVEETIKNLGRVSIPGMVETDHTILEIMLKNKPEMNEAILNDRKNV